ncbi:nuclear transport factor 2 family protein [Streptomyces sp. NPDC087270]|uniref:nuclear transport factor 2 family protein n=1 Tax=Streptomyces sp. NPDC087270 TaxID=3365774 RepID=UPI0037F37A63
MDTPLEPQTAVSTLVSRYFRALDERAFEAGWTAAFFTEDAAVRAPVGAVRGREAIAAQAEEALRRFDRTQHMSTDVLVTAAADGATADASWNALMTHLHPDGRIFTVGGRCRAALRRTADGWRFGDLSITPVWTDGEPPHLPPRA